MRQATARNAIVMAPTATISWPVSILGLYNLFIVDDIMHIVLDLLHVRTPVYTGIASMAFNLVRGFCEYSNWHVSILIWAGMAEFIADAIGKDIPKIILSDELQRVPRRKRGICPSCVKEKLAKHHADVILTTCYTIASYVYPRRYHQIGVVHDLQPFKNDFDEGHYWRALKWILQSVVYFHFVPHIVAISEFVERDIKRYSGRDTVTIYNSVCHETVSEQKIEEFENIPYILDVNSFWKYKNTERLIQAFCTIKDQIPHILYLKGVDDSKERYDEVMNFINEKGCKDRVVVDVCGRSKEEMTYLYRHASLFVSPSLKEGFGQTPIEASIHRVPVVVSNIETLREVTDGLVDCFDPHSPKSISKAILHALQHPRSSMDLEKIAAHYMEKYSPQRQIEAYMQLIESVV